jgi:hypothetical protein
MEYTKKICQYIVGYDGPLPICCDKEGKPRLQPSRSRKMEYLYLCDMHAEFKADAEVKGLFLNGKYRPMKEVKEIVKRERVT